MLLIWILSNQWYVVPLTWNFHRSFIFNSSVIWTMEVISFIDLVLQDFQVEIFWGFFVIILTAALLKIDILNSYDSSSNQSLFLDLSTVKKSCNLAQKVWQNFGAQVGSKKFHCFFRNFISLLSFPFTWTNPVTRVFLIQLIYSCLTSLSIFLIPCSIFV